MTRIEKGAGSVLYLPVQANQGEYHTSEGRIDLVLKTNKYIYIAKYAE